MDIIQKAIRKGKSEMQLLTAMVILLCIATSVSEMLAWQSFPLLIWQISLSAVLIAVAVATLLGARLRWVLFADMIITSMFSFYLSGSRMAMFKSEDVGLGIYLSVGASLAFLLGALYLAYSTEIGLFLQWKKEQRKKKA